MKKLSVGETFGFVKVADARLVDGRSGYWKWEYNKNLSKDFIKSNAGRTYQITSNNDIKKIGGSGCKGGIKSTINSYQNAIGGDPSERSYGIHIFIKEELEKGKNISVYARLNITVELLVEGLFRNEKKMHISDFKKTETMCLQDFHDRIGRYPDWNLQENAVIWPDYIKEGCMDVKNKSKEKRNKKELIS